MKRVVSVTEKGASQIMGSLETAYRRGFSRGLALALFLLAAFIVLAGSVLYGQGSGDALFIDEKGNVGVGTNEPNAALDVNGKVRAHELEVMGDINSSGTLKVKKLEGDGTAITVGGVELVKEVTGNSSLPLEQIVRAVIADMVPIGTIMAYGGDVTKPEIKTTLVAQGWLPCDGTWYGVNGYPELYDAIKNAFGFKMIEKKEHFRVPDMRGQFLRGVDHNAHRDPDAGTRVAPAEGGNTGNKVGSVQADAFQGHTHKTNAINNAHSKDAWKGGNRNTSDRKQAVVGSAITDSNYGQARISSETRPKNIYVNWIIKAKHIIR